MKTLVPSLIARLLEPPAKALLAVAATTAVLLLFGRAVLGEAVIALAYLVPVGWRASQWGQRAGVAADPATGGYLPQTIQLRADELRSGSRVL